eukprot:scaffold178_cov269-Chaetoceros_neogracile.AAC.2
MPQWGMGKGLQNVVNSWVNVNNSHVVFPGEGGDNGTDMTSSSEQHDSFNYAQHHQGSYMAARNSRTGGDNYSSRNDGGGHSIGGRSSASGGSASNNSRSTLTRSRGTIKRTNSQSDLLIERAASKATSRNSNRVPNHHQYRKSIIDDSNYGMSSTRSLVDRQASTPNGGSSARSLVDRQISMPNVTSNRILNMDTAESNSRSQVINTGQYVNENAFANHHRSMQLAAQRQEIATKSKKLSPTRSQISTAPSSTPGLSSPSVPFIERRSSAPAAELKTPSVTRSTTAHMHTSTSSVASASKSSAAVTEVLNCNKCEDTTGRILALEADLEYLRAAALNSEYLCVTCDKKKNLLNSGSSVTSGRSGKSNRSRHSKVSGRIIDSSVNSLGTRASASGHRKSRQPDSIYFSNDNMTLAEASKRLIDITARYKRQVEQLSREMGRSQNDMHLKLSKFAMMCKDLNDESAKRKEQVDNVKTDLNDVKEERNAISSELEILRARVNLYEKQEAENVEIRRLLRENQDETLAMTDQAISERDGIISDLTAKLEQSMAMK